MSDKNFRFFTSHKNSSSLMSYKNVCFLMSHKNSTYREDRRARGKKSEYLENDLFHLYIIHLLVHSNFDLVSSLPAIFVARKVAQMTTEMIECYHLR